MVSRALGCWEIIRDYAVERLAESGETPALQAGHAQYFGNIILKQAGFDTYSAKALHWLTWFERELDNIRAMLNWSLVTPQGFQLGVVSIMLLFWFMYRRGHFIEGLHWAEKFLALPEVQNIPPLRALALSSSGMMALWQGQQKTALAKLQEALAIERTAGRRPHGGDHANGEWDRLHQHGQRRRRQTIARSGQPIL